VTNLGKILLIIGVEKTKKRKKQKNKKTKMGVLIEKRCKNHFLDSTCLIVFINLSAINETTGTETAFPINLYKFASDIFLFGILYSIGNP